MQSPKNPWSYIHEAFVGPHSKCDQLNTSVVRTATSPFLLISDFVMCWRILPTIARLVRRGYIFFTAFLTSSKVQRCIVVQLLVRTAGQHGPLCVVVCTNRSYFAIAANTFKWTALKHRVEWMLLAITLLVHGRDGGKGWMWLHGRLSTYLSKFACMRWKCAREATRRGFHCILTLCV